MGELFDNTKIPIQKFLFIGEELRFAGYKNTESQTTHFHTL